MRFSLGHPKEQEPQIHRKAYFPRSTGLPVLGRAHHEHHVPIRTFQNEGWCPWDTKCRTVSKQKFVEPKVLEITWQKFFPVKCFPGDEANRDWGGTASCDGSGWVWGGKGQPIAMLCPALTHPGCPQVTCRQIHWFYLPLLLYFLLIPPFQSSCLLVLLQCIFIHYSSPTGLSVLTKLAISF